MGNIDDLISTNLSTLETEDVIYLEEYLVGDLDSHSPSLWSALKEDSEGNISPCPDTRQEGTHTDQSINRTNEESSENVDDPPVPQETSRLEECYPSKVWRVCLAMSESSKEVL